MSKIIFSFIVLLYVLSACSTSKNISRSALHHVINDSSLKNAHVGISIFEPASGKFLYDYQGDKYFVPASNTKIPTTYAAMKYLGDSVNGLEYYINGDQLVFRGTGDPTLLHPDYKIHPAFNFLKNSNKKLAISEAKFRSRRWGSGWGVNDVDASYAPERNELPVYGNILRIFRSGDSIVTIPSLYRSNVQTPVAGNWHIRFERPSLTENRFFISSSNQNFASQEIPFITGNYMSPWILLMDTLKKEIASSNSSQVNNIRWNKVYSQPTDSLLKPLMHRSDNFFAEQTLLMVSNQLLGEMNESKAIDSLLKSDFKNIPHKPRWADGSGLSRYNLFTPQGFIFILNKMKDEFGMERIKEIFPSGNEGTLTNLYKNENGYIFAKTGTLSGVVALSGFLYTKTNRILVFSVLVNNHQSSAPAIRRAIEKFIIGVRQSY